MWTKLFLDVLKEFFKKKITPNIYFYDFSDLFIMFS